MAAFVVPNGGPSWGPMFIVYPFLVLNPRAWTGSWSRPEPLALVPITAQVGSGYAMGLPILAKLPILGTWGQVGTVCPVTRWTRHQVTAGLSILVDLVGRARQGSTLPGPDSWSLPGARSWARPGPGTPGPRKAWSWSRDHDRARRSKPAGPGMDPGKIMDQGPTYGPAPGPGNPSPGKEGLYEPSLVFYLFQF